MTLKSDITSGFKVPKAYFESFDTDFILEQTLKQTVSETGFKTPDTYFEMLEIRLPKTANARTLQQLNKKTTFYLSGIAASLVLLLMFSWPSETPQTLTAEAIENYLLMKKFKVMNSLVYSLPMNLMILIIKYFIFGNRNLYFLKTLP